MMKMYGKFYEFTEASARVLHWVTLTRSDDHTRQMMQNLHIEDGQAVATDGMRMHMAQLPMVKVKGEVDKPILEDGDYHVVKSTTKLVQLAKIDDNDGKVFPSYKKLIPETEPEKSLNLWSCSKNNISKFTLYYSKIIQFGVVNIDFIKDLISHEDSWTAQYFGKNKVIVFTSGNKKALIMPMNEEHF
jgi:hypothetical protein